jgi:Na+-translocating ferredoxin:NAD+ oxidoreductase RnfC subunit
VDKAIMTAAPSLETIAAAGIVGAGGAGFPTHVKLAGRPEILLINAAECEPLLHKDGEIIRRFTKEFINGCTTASQLCGASRVIIGIKKKYQETVNALKPVLCDGIQIALLDDFYPAGDEVLLIYKVTGRIVQPGSLPISCGCTVLNVETVLNIGRAVPVTHKFLTIAGEVSEPVTLRVPVGMSIKDLLSTVKITTPNPAIVLNGVMMGTVDDSGTSVITKRSGGIIILPQDHYVVRTLRRSTSTKTVEFLANAACDQCSYCTELCPRFLLGHPVRPELAMRNRQFAGGASGNPGNVFCCECNLCTLYSCPEHLDPRGACRIEKAALRESGRKWQGQKTSAHPMGAYRAVPIVRLKQRIGIASYHDHAPFKEIDFHPAKVNIPLQQHAGAAAAPCVDAGKRVCAGECIARASGTVSANVHASIGGTVTAVTTSTITIEA